MKRPILLLLSAMMTMMMMAGNVTPEQARQLATQFMTNHLSKVRPAHRASKLIQMSTPIQVEGLHLINLDDGNGFVIVSNDDRTDAILGYSDEGTLDPENMPDNMRAWLRGYADQIKWMDEHGITVKASRRGAVKTDIAPLVESTWDQGDPYNILCPDFVSGGKCVTGCVATAMAQAMYYTAKKASLSSSTVSPKIDAYDCTTNWSGYGKVHVDEVSDGTVLNWSQMLPDYSGSPTDVQKNAVATLMKACGASVNMNYANSDNGGSSANSGLVPTALKTYFGYDPTTQYYLRSNFTYSEWIEIIYHELSHDRPVLYDGSSTGGGHAFVCDGYQNEDFFHINWGWGGSSDGFFKLSVLNPDDQGIGGSSTNGSFHYDQGMTIGLQLNGAGGTVSDIASTTKTFDLEIVSFTFSPASGSAKVGQTVTCTITVKNNGTTTYDGDITLFHKNSPYSTSGTSLNGKNLVIAPGETKNVTIEFEPTEAKTYHMCIVNQTVYLSDPSSPTDFTVISGSVATDDVDLTLTPTVETQEFISGSNYNIYGNILKATIRLQNSSTTKDYNGTFYWKVLPGSHSGSFYLEQKSVFVPQNSYIDFPIEMDGLTESSYKLYINCSKNGALATAQWSYYLIKPGITTYLSDGTKTIAKPSGATYNTPSTALSVDLCGTGITTVNKNSNPNCLYILKTTDAVPAGLTNVIQFNGTSYTAANITLTDGYDFESPVDFTATNIEFTYNNDRSADGSNGWNTIILPFDVTQVTANGTPINWFTSSSEKGKNFWLKEFSSDGASSVGFNFTSSMKANTPYIIALPGSKWGDTYNLSGKTIKFIGSGTVKKSAQSVVTGSFYRFIGNTKAVNTANIYCINAAGNKFELKSSGGSAPFRPFFKPDIFDRSVGSLTIGNGGGTTGIELPELPQEIQSDKIFDLNGRQITKPTKGIVIKNGRKVVTK